MASTDTLTAERILEATEEVLRRYGPSKANVVDVARVLGVSHGSVYRHFPTKAALREAVTERWLNRALASLSDIVSANEPPQVKLRHWLAELFTTKRRKVGDDPELFATYLVLVGEHSTLIDRHYELLTADLTAIVQEGIDRGTFAPRPVEATARAVLDATTRFRHPAHAAEWERPGIDAEFNAVVNLVITALQTPTPA